MQETIHIVQAFRRHKRSLQAIQALQYKTADDAQARAELIAERFAGVVAYSLDVNEESGEYGEPRVLVSLGEVPELA